MNDEPKEMLLNFYIEECRAFNKENEALKEENKELKGEVENQNKIAELYNACTKVLETLHIKMKEDGSISINKSFFDKSDEGYKELKEYLESKGANDGKE